MVFDANKAHRVLLQESAFTSVIPDKARWHFQRLLAHLPKILGKALLQGVTVPVVADARLEILYYIQQQSFLKNLLGDFPTDAMPLDKKHQVQTLLAERIQREVEELRGLCKDPRGYLFRNGYANEDEFFARDEMFSLNQLAYQAYVACTLKLQQLVELQPWLLVHL